MESSSSEENYEDDFEASKELKQSDLKAPLTNPTSKPPRQITSPKASVSSKPSYNPNLIFQTDQQLPKKSLKSLEKENRQLKSELQALNDRISSLLEKKTSNPQKPPSKKPSKDPKDPEIQTQQKILNYELEYLALKQIYQKFNDTDCLISLKSEVKSKKTQVEALEKDLKKLKLSIENKQKNINNYDDVGIPIDKNAHKQLVNENISTLDLIENSEKNIEKILDKQEKSRALEQELKEKFEKLSVVAGEYIVEAGGGKGKEVYEDSKKILDGIWKVTQASVTQLRIKEHDLKREDKMLDQELAKFSEWLKEKDKVLVKVRGELDEVMQMASASKLDELASLLKNINRPGSVMRSLSPRSGTVVRTELRSNSSNKNISPSPLRSSLNVKSSLETALKQNEDIKDRKKWDNIEVKTEEIKIEKAEIKKIEVKVEKKEEVNEIEKKPLDVFKYTEVKTEGLKKEKIIGKNEIPEELESNIEDTKFILHDSIEKKKIELKKPSILDELEESDNKRLEFLEKAVLSEVKQTSILDDLGKNDDKKLEFLGNVVLNEEKIPSLFDELEERGVGNTVKYSNAKEPKPPRNQFSSENIDLVQDLDLPTGAVIYKIDSKPPTEDINIFKTIPLSNPKEKRNREHLFK